MVSQLKMTMKKRGAIEFSMTTIIIIVLGVTMLIFGMIFVRNIMCSGIIITDKITENVENEIKSLFGTNDYGVKCMGEAGQEIKIGDGGHRQIACVITVNKETYYELKIDEVKSLSGASQDSVDSWILDQDWSGTVSPGQKTVSVLVLDLPQKVSDTSLKITLNATISGDNTETHTSYINVVHVSGLTSAVC